MGQLIENDDSSKLSLASSKKPEIWWTKEGNAYGNSDLAFFLELESPDTFNGGTLVKPFFQPGFDEKIQNLLSLSFSNKETVINGLTFFLFPGEKKKPLKCTIHLKIYQNETEDLPAVTAKVTAIERENEILAFPANDMARTKNDPKKLGKKGLHATILNQIGEAILCTSNEGMITYMNQAAENIYGFSLKDGLGRPITDMVKTNISLDVSKEIMSGIAVGKARYGELSVTRPDGSEIEVRAFTTPIKDDAGEVIGLVGISADISEQKRISRELKQSELRFRSFFEHATEIIVTVDKDFCLEYISPSFEHLQNINNEDLNKILFTQLVHPEEREAIKSAFLQAEKSKQNIQNLRYRLKVKSGKYRWHSLSIIPFGPESGQEGSYLCLSFDIDKLIRIESALRSSMLEAKESAARYKSVLDSQAVYIVKIDIEGNYTYVNDYFNHKFGFAAKVLGTNSMVSIVEEDWDKCRRAVQKCFEEPGVFHGLVLRKPALDGQVYSGKWEFKGIADNDGNVIEIFCVGFDVSAEIQHLEKVNELLKITQQQNERLKNFAYIISHNIRSHSSNLTGLVNHLQEAQSEEEQGVFLELLGKSTFRLDSTLKNLTEILSITTTYLPKVEIPLLLELKKTKDGLSAQTIHLDAEFDFQVPPDFVVRAVPGYLDSILLNLLDNAIKYKSEERPCKISCRAYKFESMKVIEIQDNGLGIDLERYGNKIFGMYKTFHGNKDARGLGLFITKSQIEAMDGTVEVESKENQGSIFRIKLPA